MQTQIIRERMIQTETNKGRKIETKTDGGRERMRHERDRQRENV